MAVERVEWALFILVILKIAFSSSEETCKKISVCSCELSNGTKIDLKPLDGTASLPSFTDLKSGGGSTQTFDWSPCTPFNLKKFLCTQDHVLVAQLGNGECFPAGTDDTSFSVDSAGSVVVTYGDITSGSGPSEGKRSTKITLKCDPGGSGKGSFSPFKESKPEPGTSIYSANFTSTFACAIGGDSFDILF